MAPRPTSAREILSASTKASTIARFVIRAVVAIVIAFGLTRVATARLHDGEIPPVGQLATEFAIGLCLVTIALLLSTVYPLRNLWLKIERKVRNNEFELNERNTSQRFLRDVRIAFDMTENEDELAEAAGRALADSGVVRSEILVADSSNAHISTMAVAEGLEAPACGVTSPHRCPAVKRGSTLQFGDAKGLATCPRLRERDFAPGTVAACTPINVLGTPSAVLHSVYEGGDLGGLDLTHGLRQLEGIATRFGDRLGMIRAISKTQLQANTDPLTGLLNRRAMENKVRELRSDGQPFALAMADLDHFKRLNDTYGHDTGDRALRLFAQVATRALRGEDLVCRHGGEEFVFVLPGATATTAEPALHRIREELRDTLAAARIPPFTASMGLTDSTWSDDLSEVLQAADRALLQAKDEGRDRIIIVEPDGTTQRATTIADYVGDVDAANAEGELSSDLSTDLTTDFS